MRRRRRAQLLALDRCVKDEKSFVHERLATAMGDPGCLSIFGRKATPHRLFAEHLTAEYHVRTEGRGRTVDEWKLPAHKPDTTVCEQSEQTGREAAGRVRRMRPRSGTQPLVRLRGGLRRGSVHPGRRTHRRPNAAVSRAGTAETLRTPAAEELNVSYPRLVELT